MKIISVVGRKNSGKTTLIERMIPIFRRRGLRVAVIKHDAHDFSIDREGKDTWRFRQAGADEVVIASKTQVAFMRQLQEPIHPREILSQLDRPDLVILEGYKRLDFPKIAVLAEAGQLEEMDLANDPTVVMLVVRTNVTVTGKPNLRTFTYDRIEHICDCAYYYARYVSGGDLGTLALRGTVYAS